MSPSQDESTLAQVVDEKMSLHDDKELLSGESTEGLHAMVCTAESCSVPLHDGLQQNEDSPLEVSDKEDQVGGVSNSPTTNKMNTTNKKNRRKDKKGEASQQSVSSIQQIHTQNDLNKVLQQNDTVLLEFVTTWCTACHGIQPLYEELAQREMEAVDESNGDDGMLRATQVVCDKNKETKKLADANGVGSYPVFVLFEKGKEVSKWKGADVGKLEKVFEQYGGGSAFGGKNGKGGKGKKGKGKR